MKKFIGLLICTAILLSCISCGSTANDNNHLSISNVSSEEGSYASDSSTDEAGVISDDQSNVVSENSDDSSTTETSDITDIDSSTDSSQVVEDPYKSTEYQIIEGITEDTLRESMIDQWDKWFPYSPDISTDKNAYIKNIIFERLSDNSIFEYQTVLDDNTIINSYLLLVIYTSPKYTNGKSSTMMFTVRENELKELSSKTGISIDDFLMVRAANDPQRPNDDKTLSALMILLNRLGMDVDLF